MTELERLLLYACFGMLVGNLLGEAIGNIIGWILEHRDKKRRARKQDEQ